MQHLTTQEQLVKAEDVARKAHDGQHRRDGSTPYIKHVEAVVSRVTGESEKTVAWLHDVVEDTDITQAHLLEMGFDVQIVNAVMLLTKYVGYDPKKYLDDIKQNRLAKAVKIADMRSNLADSPTRKQIERYSNGILFLTT